MLKSLLEIIKDEFSGDLALGHVTEVIRHHRIQASPGYRAAANYCNQSLEKAGVESEILSFAADNKRQSWSDRSFLEWEATEAELNLLEPENYKVCSYAQEKLSLVQRSHPTPEGGVDAELVVVEKADDPRSYEGLDVKGKVVLVDCNVRDAKRVAVDRFAIGLVSDYIAEFSPVRSRWDVPDAVQYASFWWTGADSELPAFGFSLSPRQGDRLRRLWKKRQGEANQADPEGGGFLRVHAEVKSRFYEGSIEDVVGFIPGSTEEEVIVVAHLCHPAPSANDNASGVAVALEAARALQRCIDYGKLAKPRRGIRFLLPPEMSGTYAYLAANEDRIPRTVAGLNLDMVGQDQDLCKSTLQVEYPPLAQPSFTGDLAMRILEDIAGEAKNLAGTSTYALFRYAATRFSGGSDHYILSDPTVGIPAPMVIQWPDRFYHTSEDTLDKVDPAMLYRVGVLTAAYAYFIASAGRRQALWLAHEMVERFQAEVAEEARGTLDRLSEGAGETGEAETGVEVDNVMAREIDRLERRLQFKLERKRADLASLKRLAPGASEDQDQASAHALVEALDEIQDDLASIVAAAVNRLKMVAEGMASPGSSHSAHKKDGPASPDESSDDDSPDQWERAARTMVVDRVYPGPIQPKNLFAGQPEAEDAWEAFVKEHKEFRSSLTSAIYWIDGNRTLAEVADLAELETGRRDVEYLVKYIELLEKAGHVRVERNTDERVRRS